MGEERISGSGNNVSQTTVSGKCKACGREDEESTQNERMGQCEGGTEQARKLIVWDPAYHIHLNFF